MILKNVTRHPGYVNLALDESTMDALPDDNVPEEIFAAVCWDKDEGTITWESAGYVPEDTGTSTSMLESVVSIPRSHIQRLDNNYDANNLSGLNANTRMVSRPSAAYAQTPNIQSSDPDVIPFEYSGTTAADETQITPQELMCSALKKLAPDVQQQMLTEGGYLVFQQWCVELVLRDLALY
jgi:hypothetical protein